MLTHTTRLIPASTLRSLTQFRTSGSLCSSSFSRGAGRLRGHALRSFYEDVNQVDYVVYSYATPIAWHTKARWTRVIDSFSASTGKHQSALQIPASPHNRTVGFRAALSDKQWEALYSMRNGEHRVPTGQARRTFEALLTRGLVSRDIFGQYTLTADTLDRISA